MKQCNFQNNYGFIALREVCGCAAIFNFFVDPLNFLLGANYTKKYHFFAILGAVNLHF